MPKELPFMPFWITSYRDDRDVKLMSIDERGIYLELIFELWDQGGKIENNSKDLSVLLRVSHGKFKKIFKKIEKKFNISENLISHFRVTEELEKAYSKSEKARMAAKIRWNRNSDADADAMPETCHIELELELDSKKNKQKEVDPMIDEIAEFYKANIQSEKIATGKKNLVKLHKKSKIPLSDLFQYAKNYAKFVKNKNGSETAYNVRMSNFFGQKADYQDYKVMPEMGAAKLTGGAKAGVPEAGASYDDIPDSF